MQETSRLSIVVDTRNAETQLRSFNASLRASERSGERFSNIIAKMTAGSDFGKFNQSVLNTDRIMKNLSSTVTTASGSIRAFSAAAKEMRAATTGIANNITATNSAANQTRTISNSIDAARVSSGKLGTVTRDVNRNILTLNTTLKAGTGALNQYSQAAVTAGQRLNVFGRNATQSQTRLNGLNSGLAAVRSNMASLTGAANGINSIFGNLDRTMARLAAATDRLNTATTRANTQINQLGGNFNRANGQARGLMGTLNGLQGILSGGLFAITGLSVLKTADQMQNLNSQIRIVTSSEEELLAVRTRIRDIADKNFNDVAATTDLYQKSARALANLGKSQADAVMFTDAVSLAMRTGGRSAQEQASAILQLGQAMGAGALMGDEFRSISENAPILLELVSKRMGVLPGQLKELASEGKITSEIMYDAFSQNIDLLEEMATKIPLTMGQALTVAKNQYKKYVDGIMNDTGGASSVIAGFITDIGNNFDTIAKVAIAGVVIAFGQLAFSIGTASTAMAIFNAVSKANPLILIASGFLAVNGAIFGVNDVLTISGILLSDFFEQMGIMLSDGETWWTDFSNTVAVAMGFTVKSVADANDANSKNFLGFYDETEKGFAGVVQGISTALLAVTNIFTTALNVIDNYILNTQSLIENLGVSVYNAGQRAKGFFGGEDNSKPVVPYANRNTNYISLYQQRFSDGQDGIRDYARGLNVRSGITAAPLDKQWSNPLTRGFNFSNALTPGTNSVLRNQPAGLPEWLKPDASSQPLSTSPMDLVKKAQYDQLEAQKAITAATEEREKLAKAQAKAANSFELVRKAVLGGKDWGLSNGGGFGGGRGHNGIDIPTPKGTQIYAPEGGTVKAYGSNASRGGKQMILVADSGKKYGFAHLDSFDVSNGTRVPAGMGIAKTGNSGTRPNGKGYANHLHLTVTDINGKKVDPTKLKVGKTAYDNTIGKANTAAQREATTAAAKAERERIQAAEIALREQERIEALRLKLVKEYGDKDLQLKIDHDLRVAEIRDAGFNSAKTDELIKQSEQQMSRELAVYENGLQEKVSALNNYQQTEAAMLARERDSKRFELKNDIELSRAENSELLQLALDSVDAEYEYKLERYELALRQQTNDLTAYQQTERQILINGWDAKIADAVRANDELKVIRVAAYVEQAKQELALFDLTQEDKMLELRKSHMTEMGYIKAKYDLEKRLINNSNEPQEVKDLQLEALRTPSKDALKGMLEGFEQDSPMGRIQADYEANLLILEEYEQKYTDMISVQTGARLAIEQSYMNAKRDLMLGQGEALFGDLAGMAKAFAGEQSGIYRALFAVEKGFAIAQSAIAIQQSVAKAMALGFPQNIPVIATAVSQGATLMSNIQGITTGFKQGGYTGNMGASQVAGVVHGQEYVFDAQSTKRIGVDNLNAMRSGRAANDDSKVNVNIINNSSAQVTASDDGQTITIEDVRNENKRSWSNLSNPSSYESKQLGRNTKTARRR